jgi:hypothetical protein
MLKKVMKSHYFVKKEKKRLTFRDKFSIFKFRWQVFTTAPHSFPEPPVEAPSP